MTFLWKTARSCASLSLFKYKSPAGTKPVGLKETGSQMLPDRIGRQNKALAYLNCVRAVKKRILLCCSKVIMSGVNGNVIMSGYRDENPDDEGREAARDNTKSVSRGVNDGEGIVGAGSQRPVSFTFTLF
jgi:hypothetical protein